MKKSLPRIDMTPMVDLGFLLISFFVFTTELTRPAVMNLYMPKDGPPMDLGESMALTFLVDQNKIYYYHGDWKSANIHSGVREIRHKELKEIRRIIEIKQRELDLTLKNKGGRDEMMMLIKPGKNASYKDVVDILDEATISLVKKYAILKLTPEEETWMKSKI